MKVYKQDRRYKVIYINQGTVKRKRQSYTFKLLPFTQLGFDDRTPNYTYLTFGWGFWSITFEI